MKISNTLVPFALASCAVAQTGPLPTDTVYEAYELEIVITDVKNNINDYMNYGFSIGLDKMPSGLMNFAVQVLMMTTPYDGWSTAISQVDMIGVNHMITALPWYSSRLQPELEGFIATYTSTHTFYTTVPWTGRETSTTTIDNGLTESIIIATPTTTMVTVTEAWGGDVISTTTAMANDNGLTNTVIILTPTTTYSTVTENWTGDHTAFSTETNNGLTETVHELVPTTTYTTVTENWTGDHTAFSTETNNGLTETVHELVPTTSATVLPDPTTAENTTTTIPFTSTNQPTTQVSSSINNSTESQISTISTDSVSSITLVTSSVNSSTSSQIATNNISIESKTPVATSSQFTSVNQANRNTTTTTSVATMTNESTTYITTCPVCENKGTIVSVSTETVVVSGVTTEYTTYCPLSTEQPISQVTKVNNFGNTVVVPVTGTVVIGQDQPGVFNVYTSWGPNKETATSTIVQQVASTKPAKSLNIDNSNGVTTSKTFLPIQESDSTGVPIPSIVSIETKPILSVSTASVQDYAGEGIVPVSIPTSLLLVLTFIISFV